MKKMRFSALLLLGAVLMAGCGGASKKAQKQEEADPRVLISAGVAQEEMIDQTVRFSSSIQAVQTNHIVGMTGRINKIYVKVGDRVSKGQLLVEMDKAQYVQTQAQLATAEESYKKMKSAYDAGGVSQLQMDELETSIKVLREAARTLRDNVELRSPLTGVVTQRYFDPGDMFGPGQYPILQVMDMSRVKVNTTLSESYFSIVKLGMPVEVEVEVLPGKTFNGKVSLIYPTIDPMTRTFGIEVEIPNTKQIIRSGMFSRSTINFGMAKGVTVTDLAVQKQMGTNEKYVYVIEGDSVVRRHIEAGKQLGDKIVINAGLRAGDKVALTGFTKLSNGTKVEVKE